jgi:hypothetical protein
MNYSMNFICLVAIVKVKAFYEFTWCTVSTVCNRFKNIIYDFAVKNLFCLLIMYMT